MSAYLGTVTRSANPNTNATVYAAYLEVTTNFPPIVNLGTPSNNAFTNLSSVNFTFIATDDYDNNLSNCSLWGNFSGSWARNITITAVTNGTMRNITKSLPNGTYIWNINCSDYRGHSAFNSTNYTVTVDTIIPAVTSIYPLNNTLNKTTNNTVFQYNVTDLNSILNCSLYINSIYDNSTANPTKGTTLSFTKTMSNGNYTWFILCMDQANNTNKSATRNLNISVYPPVIQNILADQNITLNAGSIIGAKCNFTVIENNGVSDLSLVNATFRFYSTPYSNPDNYNNHYTNTSCQIISTNATANNYSCIFYMQYYANNGSWYCNISASNVQLQSDNDSNTTSIDALFALNVSLSTLDYGDIVAANYSTDQTLVLTNSGNQAINISVKGYGGTDPVAGAGNAFACVTYNISITNERYAKAAAVLFASKTQLSSTNQDMGTTIAKQTLPATPMTNTTYWQVYAPPGKVEFCTGTIAMTVTAQ